MRDRGTDGQWHDDPRPPTSRYNVVQVMFYILLTLLLNSILLTLILMAVW